MSDGQKPQGYECDCPCGGMMLRKTLPHGPVQCPRCGRTPLDLLLKSGEDV